jgi:hypothetical protein
MGSFSWLSNIAVLLILFKLELIYFVVLMAPVLGKFYFI